jgi:uncharacterized protein YdaU (DUF1376 family)
MAKDPAVLFYTSDFLTGTILMTYEQKGKYITLLCIQHQKGVLSEKDMLNICQSYDKDIYDKFIKTDEGYYNKRMREEHEKRANFSKSRSENRLKGIENQKNKSKKKAKSSYDNHMEDENENNIKYSFVKEEFKKCFFKWMQYKTDRKEKYKSLESEKSFYNKLITLSDNKPNIASLIIEQSIANNWAGVFELKNKPVIKQTTAPDYQAFING